MRSPADPRSAARPPEQVPVRLPITLGQFLKVAGLAATGGEAKYLVVTGSVVVNGATETRRGRHLAPGDEVALGGATVVVAVEDLAPEDHLVAEHHLAPEDHPEHPARP